MGWCSGTEIAEVVMYNFPTFLSHSERIDFFKKFINVMWDHDWDCEADMDYMDPDFFAAIKELNPEMADGLSEMYKEYPQHHPDMEYAWKK